MKRAILASMTAVVCLAAAPATAQIEIDSNTFGALRARSIGPAVMSGRIAAMDAVPADPGSGDPGSGDPGSGGPVTLWVGSASGGVWVSEDGGITFDPVFDDHTQSIGALRIDPSDPDTVWVGTGESWVRNSVSVGTGLYKTTDGGDSWTLVGLADSERIARIVIHPEETDTVWVCATGHLWDANEERGVYKTTDGGESWERVLYVDADTGCSDLAIDPQEPSILYAGMWQFRRYPDFFESGGPGSGLYKSTDGGESWTELTAGLPAGDKGRIAVAPAPSRPSRVYAVVEAEETALYRSDDLGATWEEMNDSFAVSARPFYFAYLVVDPENHERVYKPGFYLAVSHDGGRSFTSLLSGFGSSVHPDHHALWIDPTNPRDLYLGTDGGVYVSHDRADSFRFVGDLPVSQFYEVSADTEWPYNVYGGLQDNGSWMGPSQATGGIQAGDWRLLGFGDGFHAYRDPDDRNIVYVEFQGGNLLRHHLATEEIKWIQPYPKEGEEEYRFNWNSPIHLSPSTPGTVYYGAQYLLRSRDRGESWETISPDLTTDDPELQRQEESGGLTIDNSTAENNATIYTISESPLDGEVIWVGTDDGYVQVTRDGGATWTNVTENVPGVPERTWVSHVEASPHDAATSHVTFDGHRSGDMTPYVFRTRDSGATWEPIAGEEMEGFAHVVVQDPENPALLFVGTEMGLWLTVDGGERWARFEGGLPRRVPVHDVDVQAEVGDLVIGTHGRGIYILDDLSPLRAIDAETLEASLELLPSRPAVMMLSGGASWFNGDDQFVGSNPPEAASIFYYQKRRHIFGDMNVEIHDDEGELITTVPAGKVRGMNRVDWPMRLPPPKLPPATALAPAFVGPRVPEGTYTYKLVKGKETYEGTVTLVPDPRSPHSAEDRQLQQETALDLYRKLERLTYVVDAAIDLRDQARERADGAPDKLAERLEELADGLEELRTGLVSTSEAGWISGDEKLREKLANVYSAVSSYDGRPTASQLERTATLTGQLEEAEAELAELADDERLAELNRELERRDLQPLDRLEKSEWEEEQEAFGATAAATGMGAKELVAAAMGVRVPLGF